MSADTCKIPLKTASDHSYKIVLCNRDLALGAD